MVDLFANVNCDADVLRARAVLAAFGDDLRAADIDCPPSATGFSGALILRVRAGDRSYCLRRWPRGALPAQRLQELHHFLAHLRTCGLCELAVPVASCQGETLTAIEGDLWQLEPWLPGTADFHQSATDARLRSAMHTLARVHVAAQRYPSRSTGREWFARHTAGPSTACRERLALIDEWSEPRCDAVALRLTREPSAEFRATATNVLQGYRRARSSVTRELSALRDVPYRLHPCLRDVWHDHLLFTGDQLTGLVDPSATRTENVAADLSRLLGSLLGDDCLRWEFALATYAEVRPLTENERRLITALDHSGVLLSGLTWIERRLTGQLTNDHIPRVLSRLETINRRLQNLG